MPPMVSFFSRMCGEKGASNKLLLVKHFTFVELCEDSASMATRVLSAEGLMVSTSHYIKAGQTELALGQQTQLGQTEALLFNICI